MTYKCVTSLMLVSLTVIDMVRNVSVTTVLETSFSVASSAAAPSGEQ